MFADGLLLWRLMSLSVWGKYSLRLSKNPEKCFFLFLKNDKCYLFIYFSQLRAPTDWLTGGYSIHQRCAQPKSLLQPWEASRRCARQAGGTEGDCVSGLPDVYFHVAAGPWPHLFWRASASCSVRIPSRRAWSCCPRQRPVEVLLSAVCLWGTAENKITSEKEKN